MRWLTGAVLLAALSGSGLAGCLGPGDDFDFAYDSADWTDDWTDDCTDCTTGEERREWRAGADPPMDPDVWFIDHRP